MFWEPDSPRTEQGVKFEQDGANIPWTVLGTGGRDGCGDEFWQWIDLARGHAETASCLSTAYVRNMFIGQSSISPALA